MPALSLLGAFLYFILPGAILYTVNALFLQVPIPKNVPLVREPPGKTRFSLKTRLAYLTDCESLFREAHQQYLKHGKAVIIPGFGLRNEVILPSSSLRWALAQPASVLSVSEAFGEIDQPQYSLGHMAPILDPWQGLLVRQDINATLEVLATAMNDELRVAFDTHFGTEGWREVDLMKTVRMIVAQAASRFTVGLPLCMSPS